MYSNLLIDDEMGLKDGPQYLLFHLQSHLFALKAEYVSEIVELPEITKIPWMQPCVKGVCNIRGSVIGVLDIAKYLMDANSVSSQKSALVIVTVEFEDVKHRVGIIVDEVCEIEVFEEENLQTTPKFGLPFDSKYVESMAHFEDTYIPILLLQNVVSLEELSILEEL